MMDIEVPDYNALKKIPSGSTISLFPVNARLYNMDNVETTVLYPDNVDNWKDAVGDGNYWPVAHTMKEYKKMTGDNLVPTQLKGDMKKDNGWEQTALLPTSEGALCFLAYHNSQQHSQVDNETILIALRTQQLNLAWHTGQKRVSFFQRARSIQIMQLHNKGYVMSEQEVNNLRILKLTYNVTSKFLTYNWNKDFLWY